MRINQIDGYSIYLSLAEALTLVSARSVGHEGGVLALHSNEVLEK